MHEDGELESNKQTKKTQGNRWRMSLRAQTELTQLRLNELENSSIEITQIETPKENKNEKKRIESLGNIKWSNARVSEIPKGKKENRVEAILERE